MTTILKILKSKWTPVVIIIVLLGTIYLLWSSNSKKAKEIDRLSNNQEALLSDLEIVKGKYGIEVAKVQALELSKNEFEKLYNNQVALVDNLKLKVKRLETVIQTSTAIRDSVIIEVEKPIYVKDTSSVVRPFNFSDSWVDIRGELSIKGLSSSDDATILLDYAVKDTLDLIVYREPKRFLFIKYGIKRLDCYINSRNPKSSVIMGSCVVLKNRKGGK